MVVNTYGNIFDIETADALVNVINCIEVMGTKNKKITGEKK